MVDEWTPEKEAEDDPAKLQKEQIKIGRELLDRIKRQEEEEKARKEEYEAQPVVGAPAYKPATFEEVSAVLKKAWDEVERIMPGATDQAKTVAFNTLVHASRPMSAFMG